MVEVEDLYRPYRPKRRTRAIIAKERGLEPLAAFISLQSAKEPLEREAQKYVDPEKEVASPEEAIAGARDIIAENISDDADYRSHIRKLTRQKGRLVSKAKDEEAESVYEMYYDFEEPVTKLAGHRILAINRGEKEKIPHREDRAPQEDILRYLEKKTIHRDNPYTSPVLREAVEDSYKRLIAPAIEREIRSELTESAEDGAIRVFGKNLEQLLMQPPIAGRTVLGWDPAFRTGCKLAVVDPTGKVIGTTVIYPHGAYHAPEDKGLQGSAEKIIPKYNISLISLGNGTASRESEQFIVGASEGNPPEGGVRHCQRGWRLCVLGQQAGLRGVPQVRCGAEERRLHRQETPGSAGGAGEDRSQVYRRGPVPARHEPEEAERRPLRCGRGLREQSGAWI